MDRDTLKNLTCPFCGERGPSIRYDYDVATIVRCSECSLMWLHPMPNLDDLHEIYTEEYYANNQFLEGDNNYIYGYSDYIAERINKQWGYKRFTQEVKQKLPEELFSGKGNHASWLDIGCGLGYLLDMAFDAGFAVQGIEFNSAAVQYIRSKYTFDVAIGTIEDLPQEDRFHVISMFDLIEHLTNPFSDLKKLRTVIHDNGYLLIQTMDSESWTSRLIGKRLEDFRRIREHLYFFSRTSLTRILEEAGWEVTEIRSVGHTFQIGFLMDRIAMISSVMDLLMKGLRKIIYPRYLLDAHIHVNPRTKMMIVARPISND